MTEIRCKKCKRLLMRVIENEDVKPTQAYTANLPVEVKCPKCRAKVKYEIGFMHNQPDGEYLTVISS